MKLINARDFHKNPGKYFSELQSVRQNSDSDLDEENQLTIIMRRNKPVCVLSPITESEFLRIKLNEDIEEALEEIRTGQSVSHAEITKRIFDKTTELQYTRYKIIYANRALSDLEVVKPKDCQRILKKLYEKCHFSNPFDRHIDIYNCVYSEIKIGRYIIVCVKDEGNIYVLCIYPPHGSRKEKFRL